MTSPNPLCDLHSEAENQRGRSALALIEKLHASLLASQKALLALDLAGIERGTREQAGLVRGLATLLRNAAAAGFDSHCKNDAAPSLAGPPGLTIELRAAAHRVIRRARVQSALLVRMRSKLRILSNMLADPTASYAPLLAGGGITARETR